MASTDTRRVVCELEARELRRFKYRAPRPVVAVGLLRLPLDGRVFVDGVSFGRHELLPLGGVPIGAFQPVGDDPPVLGCPHLPPVRPGEVLAVQLRSEDRRPVRVVVTVWFGGAQ